MRPFRGTQSARWQCHIAIAVRARRSLRSALSVSALSATLVSGASAQQLHPAAAARASGVASAWSPTDSTPVPFFVAGPATMGHERGVRRSTQAPLWAPALSALVPGAGQAVLDQDRWIAYAAVELMAWLRYFSDHQEARAEQRRYQNIANNVARALYTTGTAPDGSFDYYETMEKWTASGVYDALPGGELEPETDSATYNGATWLLARQTFWADPNVAPLPESDAYRSAIAFYDRRAIRPDYRWSWRDAQLQQDLYRRAILHSNAAYRRATQDLAVVLANHVLSTVDAYITLRLRRGQGPLGGETSIEATLPWP